MFRGREVFHPELGKQDPRPGRRARARRSARWRRIPRLDGRNMTMVLAPDKRAQAKKPSRDHGQDHGHDHGQRHRARRRTFREPERSRRQPSRQTAPAPDPVPVEATVADNAVAPPA